MLNLELPGEEEETPCYVLESWTQERSWSLSKDTWLEVEDLGEQVRPDPREALWEFRIYLFQLKGFI